MDASGKQKSINLIKISVKIAELSICYFPQHDRWQNNPNKEGKDFSLLTCSSVTVTMSQVENGDADDAAV